jgi:hypothetical protein
MHACSSDLLVIHLIASPGGEIDVTGAITRLTQRRALALIDQRKMRFARGA